MNLEKLRNYTAKVDSNNIRTENIYEHNDKLKTVLNNIIDIYALDSKLIKKLEKCINYHDIGKCTDEMQNNFSSKYRNVRHEMYGASVKTLGVDERLAILTHHKTLNYFIRYLENEIYAKELIEVSEKLQVELENIEWFIRKMNRDKKVKKELNDINNILLKGFLNYCDHLGSADILKIEKGFNSIMEFKIPEGYSYNSIQQKVLDLQQKQDIMVNAMTGLGKTATSMYYTDLVQNEGRSRRIYYILPFTASINSLFIDFQERHLSVAMLHSKAEYFLSKNEEFEDENIKDIYNLFKKSNKQITICTIFQIIKAAFSCRRFEMLLAQLKNSIFIIDEIHCFETKELCFILEFLKFAKEKLDINICIMSASMPTCLQKLILHKINITKLIVPEVSDLIERHRVYRIKDEIIHDLNNIKNELENDKQVIVCVNSVHLAQQIYREFKDKYNCKLIHGRFNSRDREKAENDLKSAKLLIGTQSIEVSLDIDYDVMFTEIAPFDSLLQRFGRVNRKGRKQIANIYIYDDTSNLYNDAIINNTNKVIEEIIENDNKIILEHKINYYLDKVYEEIDMKQYNKYEIEFNRMLNDMTLGNENRSATDNMCLNDNVSVLPICLFNEYINYINNKDYLNAQSLLVNIKRNKLIYNKDKFIYSDDYKINITHYKYTKQEGLDYESTEDEII